MSNKGKLRDPQTYRGVEIRFWQNNSNSCSWAAVIDNKEYGVTVRTKLGYIPDIVVQNARETIDQILGDPTND